MRIERIQAFGLRGGTPEGGWSNELRPDDCVHTLVAVITDTSLVGWGSCFTNDSLVQASLDVLEPMWRGENALEPDRVSDSLERDSFWMGRGGAITHTISGIDIALWDILGQATGRSVGSLLGGRYRDRVRPYASVLMDAPQRLHEQLTRLRQQRFRAFKIGWGPFGREGDATDEAIVSAARDAVGSESMLMVDAGASDGMWPHGLSWARRTADMLASYRVDWFEEPLPPDAIDDYVLLRRTARLPIATGEVLTRRASFIPWIARGALDIVQPDVTKAGGLSVVRRIAWAAADHHVRVVPHGWNTAVGLAADLQLSAALRDTDLVEYRPGSPYIDELAEWRLDADGMLGIPDVPGLGIRIDADALARYVAPDALRALPGLISPEE